MYDKFLNQNFILSILDIPLSCQKFFRVILSYWLRICNLKFNFLTGLNWKKAIFKMDFIIDKKY